MNLPYFIAKRLAFTKSKSFTRVILNIAIVGLGISVCVMILSGATIRGFKKEINSKIFGFWGHIHISDANISREFELKPIDVNQDYFKKLKDINFVEFQEEKKFLGKVKEGEYYSAKTEGGVEAVNPYIVMPCLVETKSDMVAGLFKGISKDYKWDKMQRFLNAGRGISNADTTNQIVVSKNIADKLGLAVDKKLIVTFIKDRAKLKRAFKVVGIYNTGLEEYDERFIIGNAEVLQQILDWQPSQYSGVEVFLDNVSDMEVMNEYIYANVLPSQMYSETIKDKFPNIFEWLKLQDINEKVILLLMASVAIINLITVLLILILERTKMVGVMKSLGASDWMIRRIFIFHASFILLLGLLVGNILGLGIAFIQKNTGFIKLDENNYYLDTAPIEINWLQVAYINIGALVLCFLILLIPSLLISQIKPVKALKFS